MLVGLSTEFEVLIGKCLVDFSLVLGFGVESGRWIFVLDFQCSVESIGPTSLGIFKCLLDRNAKIIVWILRVEDFGWNINSIEIETIKGYSI